MPRAMSSLLPKPLFVAACLWAALSGGARADNCGIQAVWQQRERIALQFDPGFDLERGFLFGKANERARRVSVTGGTVTLDGQSMKTLPLALDERFYFGGDHYGCSVTHVVVNHRRGARINSGAETPGVEKASTQGFLPAQRSAAPR